jgi:hypothetical protein
MLIRDTRAEEKNELNCKNVKKNEKNIYNIKQENIKKMIKYLKSQNKNDKRTD